MAIYSFIIPAYNEGARLGSTLDRVLDYIRVRGWDAEVVVVNDGSRDQTTDLVRAIAQAHPGLRFIENTGKCDQGYSMRSRIIHALCHYLMYHYPDLSSPTSV